MCFLFYYAIYIKYLQLDSVIYINIYRTQRKGNETEAVAFATKGNAWTFVAVGKGKSKVLAEEDAAIKGLRRLQPVL